MLSPSDYGYESDDSLLEDTMLNYMLPSGDYVSDVATQESDPVLSATAPTDYERDDSPAITDIVLIEKKRKASEFGSKTRKKHRSNIGISTGDFCFLRNLVLDKISSTEEGDYKEKLRELSKDAPTKQQLAKMKLAGSGGPNYLGRTVSQTSGMRREVRYRQTNGHTTHNMLMPAADTHDEHAVHGSIGMMTQGEVQYMLGQHLIWNDIPGDEFLSHSVDPLFLVQHALNRHEKGQGDVTIQFLDRRTMTDMTGKPAVFYRALDLYDIFKVPVWGGWTKRNIGALLPRKFTQEYLSHGTIATANPRFHQAKIVDLIRDGLYDVFPPFKIPAEHDRAELYTGQVVMRGMGYPPRETTVPIVGNKPLYSYDDCEKTTPFTVEFLRTVQKLTRLFGGETDTGDGGMVEPHLHVFICFLTFEKRLNRDPVFLEWIKSHYKGESFFHSTKTYTLTS